VLEFAQQLVTITEGLVRRTYFEPALIAFFGLALMLSARVINRVRSFLALQKTEHVPDTRTESVVEIRLGEVRSATWEMSASACSQAPAVGVNSSNAA
jgi:hypothetical protein